jgi:hypothetical protein
MSLDQVTQQQWKKIISCNLMELPIGFCQFKLLKIQYLPQHNLGLKKLILKSPSSSKPTRQGLSNNSNRAPNQIPL